MFDDDERQYTDPTYAVNHGPFSEISIQLNKALKKLDAFAPPNLADWVGYNTSLNLKFQYPNKQSFIITVWECSAIPNLLVSMARDTRIFGLSQQITELWDKYGINAPTVYPGCDTDFWKPVCEKNPTFTFLHINSSNVRSGLDLTIQAFHKVFKNYPYVQLVIKDTNDSPQLCNKIRKYIDEGSQIFYYSKRISYEEIRRLYSSSHVCLNLLRSTSFGLPLLECSACGCLCVTGDTKPTNEIIKPEYGVLVPPSDEVGLEGMASYLSQEWGLRNCYPALQYNETPKFWDFSVEEYAKTLEKIYSNWDTTYSKIDTRTPIVENWTWEKSAKTLINLLENGI